jgi:hypothetical protein
MKRCLIVICCFLLLACEKENVDQNILGQWEWQENRYNSRGTTSYTLSPNSSDTSMVIKVNPTTIEIYKNDSFFGEFTYTTNTVIGERNFLAINYNNVSIGLNVEEGPFYIENGKLYVIGGYNDAGSTQIFQRVK